MSLLARVQRFAARHSLWRETTRVVAAVSGGSDSVAMLFLLRDLHSRGALVLDAVAHLNHCIRPDADDDEMFCRALAERLGLPFESARVDVPAQARASKQSLELAGRLARRAFLDDVRRRRGAEGIATAHTEDDQAETVLLRLMRGAGSRGLAGIAPCRDRRLRPMLCATRRELQDDLTARGESWREDTTNADLTHLRNRVRHQLLPYLEEHFNPSARRALARTADVVRAEDEALARLAAAATVSIVRRDDRGVFIDGRLLRAQPEAIARRVAIFALNLAGASSPEHDEVAAILDATAGEVSAIDLSGVRAEHFAGNVVLVPSGRLPAPTPPASFRFDLPVPGVVRTDAGWLVQAEAYDCPQLQVAEAAIAQIDAAAVVGGLIVRSRQPGDRVRPVGLGGTKKLQDVLVDRKVSRDERGHVPIVLDETGRIVWVAGHVVGEEFRVTERTKGVIILKLRRI
jgi:tRNA(Ile)-lysidine synthase